MVLSWIHRTIIQCQQVQRQRMPVYCNHFRCKISLQWHVWANRRLAQLRLVNHFLALNLVQPQHLYVRYPFLIQYFTPIVISKSSFYHPFKLSRINKICNHLIIFIGSVQDYSTAALPQYTSGLYAPTLTTANALNTTASLVAGKQIEGKYHLHWIIGLN